MKDLDLNKVHEYVNDSTMILIINNNSKLLLDYLFNLIYKKNSLQKYEYDKCKGIIKKIEKLKDKIIKINLDLNKVQLTSSNNRKKILTDFMVLRSIVDANCSKILCKTDLSTYKEYVDLKYLYTSIPSYDVFDLIFFIGKENIKIIKKRGVDYTSRNLDKVTFNMDQLIRKTKLKQLKNKLKLYDDSNLD